MSLILFPFLESVNPSKPRNLNANDLDKNRNVITWDRTSFSAGQTVWDPYAKIIMELMHVYPFVYLLLK